MTPPDYRAYITRKSTNGPGRELWHRKLRRWVWNHYSDNRPYASVREAAKAQTMLFRNKTFSERDYFAAECIALCKLEN